MDHLQERSIVAPVSALAIFCVFLLQEWRFIFVIDRKRERLSLKNEFFRP
jgi:hypothetical protein